MRILILVVFIMLILTISSCGSSPVPEAAVARLRVKLMQMRFETPSTEPEEEKQKFVTIAHQTEELEAFHLTATAYSLVAKYFENLGDENLGEKQKEYYQTALEYFQKALFYDKKDQNNVRSATDPYPNSNAIAISLNNISVIFEKLGEPEKALNYAGRAYQINHRLNYYSRITKDCERIIKLYKNLGNENAASEYKKILENTEIKLAEQQAKKEADSMNDRVQTKDN